MTDITCRPTSDAAVSGTWAYSSGATGWNLVAEAVTDDLDYITSPATSSTYFLFGFANPSVPAGSTIGSVTVYYRVKDAGGTNNVRAAVAIGSAQYLTVEAGNNPGNGIFTSYSYTFLVNPDTGAAWTVDDLNGTGANPLSSFGVSSTDASPVLVVSQVYMVISYTEGSGQAVSVDGSGGVVLGGEADVASFFVQAGSVAGSGGSVTGGVCGIRKGISVAAIGGVVAGGQAVTVYHVSASAMGGSVCGGSAGVAMSGVQALSVASAGGAALGGAIAYRIGSVRSGAGGSVFGGASGVASSGVQSASVASTGGLVAGGSAVTVYRASISVYSSGGVVFGGMAHTGAPVALYGEAYTFEIDDVMRSASVSNPEYTISI